MRAEALAELRRDGYARLGRVLDEATLARLRERCDDLMLGRVDGRELFFQHDSASGAYEDLELRRGYIGPSLAYRKLERLERDPVVRAWIENPLYAAIARAWIGPEVSLYRAMLMNKAAGGGTALPWHQDGGLFWGVDREPTLQIWTALDDATADSGALEVVPGSHAAGLVRPSGGTVPAELAATAEGRARLVPAAAGEAILVHNHVWHRSGRNASPAPRRALSFCYMDARTRCTRTRRAPREFLRVFG
jgi:ectoine hydroxylase-related dioxygenase (phytanoyl-CoA dioxygenase family)